MEEILQKKMDRKEFLIWMGGIVVTVIGISNVLHTVKNLNNKTVKTNTSFGYGPYGGKKLV